MLSCKIVIYIHETHVGDDACGTTYAGTHYYLSRSGSTTTIADPNIASTFGEAGLKAPNECCRRLIASPGGKVQTSGRKASLAESDESSDDQGPTNPLGPGVTAVVTAQ
ncbi:hypothetical protein PG995_011553 [Apiospora arundinis]